MECTATALTEEWVQEVELRYTESDKSKSDMFLYVAPIMPQPAPDFVQLCDMADSMCDADTEGAIEMTEEQCVKIEMLQTLLSILPADDIPRLNHIIPEVYITTCTDTRRTSISCATPPYVPRKVPNVCEFRCQLRIVREYLLFTSKLTAKACDTHAIFHIEELLLTMMSGLQREIVPCKCDLSMWTECSELEYFQFLLSTRSEETGEIVIPQPPPDPFQHRSMQDSEDRCHCDMCVERREQEMKPGGPHPEVDLHTVWQAFYDVQTFMEEYASFSDLSHLHYVEQRLYRITQYSIMQWFCENGLHSYSDLFSCPCIDSDDDDDDCDDDDDDDDDDDTDSETQT